MKKTGICKKIFVYHNRKKQVKYEKQVENIKVSFII